MTWEKNNRDRSPTLVLSIPAFRSADLALLPHRSAASVLVICPRVAPALVLRLPWFYACPVSAAGIYPARR
jgi:hypothetical protein